MRNKYFSMRKAFTLTEVLIAMIVIGIVGGVAVTVMWFLIGSHFQLEDYTAADSEMEYVFQRIARDIALVGLGMPNNRGREDSFALSFTGSGTGDSRYADRPIMARFGNDEDDHRWGGPVTVSSADAANGFPVNPGWVHNCELHGEDAYVGPELFYAWGVPTGVNVITSPTGKVEDNMELTLGFDQDGKDKLETFRYDMRAIGVEPDGDGGENMRTWLLLPTLRLPLRADGWDGTSLDVTVAPFGDTSLSMTSTLMELDEVHLVQAARIFLRGDMLVRQIFGEDYTDANNIHEDILARGIVGLRFAYNPERRILQMHIAARGRERDATGAGQPARWPSCLPDLDPEDTRHRILVKSVTWRIRN